MVFQGIKGIAFDLDGTLLDSAPDLGAAINVMLTDLGAEPVCDQLSRQWVGNGMPKLVQRAMAHAKLCSSTYEQAFTLFTDAYAADSSSRSRLYEGVAPALAELHKQGMAMALITNKAARFLPSLLADFDLADYFSIVLGGDTLQEKKPHPLPLLHVCQQWQIKPSELLMVGDSKNDVQAGQAAGAQTLGLTYGYNYGEHIALSNPDQVADNLIELAQQLASTNQHV
ncbi:phosphoglycolate phosphatase [Neiella marina]|uniref:Phosphoglycolate phosphatase n=1 Tax=Neiella holothuriorum TaxID=2870530 RepID=A0ABS7ECQ4_9GAMM|nr:phosphoglycolate phosphatase [Neiella holothuriorum]MBW8190010.1 phosphoglycolate phosphatase [Neiella holothuriorum]